MKEDACMSTEFKAWLRTASEEDKVVFADLGQTYLMDEMQRMLQSLEHQKKKAEDNMPIEPEKPDKGTEDKTDKGTVDDGDKETEAEEKTGEESSDDGDNISNDNNNKGIPLDNNQNPSSPNGAIKTEKKGKEKGNKVSTPEMAPTKGSDDETATATPAKGSFNKSTKDKKQHVVTETITASHGIVSNVIPHLRRASRARSSIYP